MTIQTIRVGLLLMMTSIQGWGMSAEEAYQAIPHRRTVFEASTATMPAVERDYLVKLFETVDLAVVAKVSAGRSGRVDEAYQPFRKALQALKPPAKLEAVQNLVGAAAADQEAYLKEWKGQFNSAHPRVRSASGKLHQAYGELMRLYPSENPHNKQAFFDYLCALDFI